MGKEKKKSERKDILCKKCQFNNKATDNCMVKDVKKCSKQDITECDCFLIRDKLVMF